MLRQRAKQKEITGCEMYVLLRSLRIFRQDRISNEEIRRKIGSEGTLFQDIERNQLIQYGHIQRIEDERLSKKVVMEWVTPYHQNRRMRKSWKEGILRAAICLSAQDLRVGMWNDRINWMIGIGQC